MGDKSNIEWTDATWNPIEAWVPRPEAETTIEGEVSWSDGRVEEHEQ